MRVYFRDIWTQISYHTYLYKYPLSHTFEKQIKVGAIICHLYLIEIKGAQIIIALLIYNISQVRATSIGNKHKIWNLLRTHRSSSTLKKQ